MRIKTTGALVVVVGLLAGCGGSSGASSSTSSTSTGVAAASSGAAAASTGAANATVTVAAPTATGVTSTTTVGSSTPAAAATFASTSNCQNLVDLGAKYLASVQGSLASGNLATAVQADQAMADASPPAIHSDRSA